MRKKTIIIAFIIIVVLSGGIFWFLNRPDSQTTLTVVESNWIDNHKNKVIDLAVLNSIPVLNDSGDGLFFDFLTNFEDTTGLEFNKSSYESTETATSDYAFESVDKKTKNDILIYQDNYVLLTKKTARYQKTSDIQNLTIGTLNNDMSNISQYLKGSSNILYKGYDSTESLINDMNTDVVDAIAVPKLTNLDKIISNENLNIAYNINEYTKDYVLHLGNNKTLNKILKKYYVKWSKLNYNTSFNKYFSSCYFKYSKTSDKEKATFRSKRYSYGFLINSPYDTVVNSQPMGFNIYILKNFAKLAQIEIDYKKYTSINALVKDFNENKLDLAFENQNTKYTIDINRTNSVYSNEVAVISHIDNDVVINSIYALKDQSVVTIKDSKIAHYLDEKGIKYKAYNNISELLGQKQNKNIIVIDEYTYDFHVRNALSDYKLNTTFNLDDYYSFIQKDTTENKTFNNFYTFYLSYIDEQTMISNSYKDLLASNQKSQVQKTIFVLLLIIFILIILNIVKSIKNKKKDNNSSLTKKEKLKYVDTLTSLKNRNYLNDNVKLWDSSEVYPQAIIIVDLNNINYINDNYGHSEGDKVIVEAAGILIEHQLENSEIMRTDGNEFLIYTINNSEKEIVAYTKKLSKDFKKLTYGFGSAIGYSIIEDAIKTIDDAVSEAVQDMRQKKEE